MNRIPAIWRIDVEPDDVAPGPDQPPWNGFVAMAGLVDHLRRPLADRSGAPLNPTWFLRLDPEIERCYGRADFVAHRYRELMDQIRGHGDQLGIHVHYYRWDEQRQAAYSDHADASWVGECIRTTADNFGRCFGEPVRRSSQGGYFVSEAVVEQSIAIGIQVDVTPEPGLESLIKDVTFGAYATAPTPDFQNFPRRPYYPSRTCMGEAADNAADARPLLIVPLTSYDYEAAESPWLWRTAKKILRRPQHPLPLNPWKAWPSPKNYWDLVAKAVDEGTARYFAFAIRTDGPGSETFLRAKALLEYLPQHPIAKRLCFVDPLSPEIRAIADAGMN